MWKVCQYPSLLHDKERTQEPQEENYGRDEDGTVNELFWIHVQQYELSRLRELFFARMEIVEPRWMAEYRASELKADFGWAVENCDTAFCRGSIRKWLER